MIRSYLYYVTVTLLSITGSVIISVLISLFFFGGWSALVDVLLWVSLAVVAITVLFGGNYTASLSGRRFSNPRAREIMNDSNRREKSFMIYVGGVPSVSIYVGMCINIVGVLIYLLNFS